MSKKLLTSGNLKMKEVVIFNLPRLKTCRPTKFCAKNCYAKKAEIQYKAVKLANEYKYGESLKNDFADVVIEELKRKRNKVDYFRIHASGDFYSEDYIDKWIKICKTFPDTKFLAFTKRRDLISKLQELNNLSNVIIYESLDPSFKVGKIDNFPKSIITEDKKPKIDNTEFLCPGTHIGCKTCDYLCWKNKEKDVIFIKH